MLGEAHIPTGFDDDRRAAEWRLVQEAQAGRPQGLRASLSRERAEGLRLVHEAVVESRARRGADPGGFHPGVEEAGLLPGPELLLLVALPPHRERGPIRAAVADAASGPGLRDRRRGGTRAHAESPRPGGGLRPREGMAALPPGARASSCSTTWKAGPTRRSHRFWDSPPGPPRRNSIGPAGF